MLAQAKQTNAEETQISARECFIHALHISRRQGAKSLELRAAMSLGRLEQQQGLTQPARQRLSQICNWFTEGFDTKDLKDAQSLLAELARG